MPGHGPGSRRGVPCEDHLGRKYKSLSEMCRAYGLSTSSYLRRVRKGMPVEQALTAPKKKGPARTVSDHLGNVYQSLADMLRAYGVSYTVYHYRHEVMGWDKETALTTPPGDTDMAGAHACRDHLGNEFPSKKAMCDYWRVPRNVYFLRKKAGMSLKDCLAPIPAKNGKPSQANKITDHLGNGYRNLDDMCAAWDISKAQYLTNIRNNLPVGRALTEKTVRPDKPRDHKGNEYGSINAMCRAYGITKTVLRSRLELGWTLKEILEHPENNSHYVKAVDHLGQEFACQKDMLAHWGVTHTTYKHRLKRGWDLEHALSPESLHAQPCKDHLGQAYPCLQAMLDYWFCQTATYHHRLQKLDWPLEQVLATVRCGMDGLPGISILRGLDSWFLVETDRSRYLLNTGQVLSAARRNAMIQAIRHGSLPAGMRARHVSGDWFQVWGTSGTGSAPGVILSADGAWMERCLERYRDAGRRRGGKDGPEAAAVR